MVNQQCLGGNLSHLRYVILGMIIPSISYLVPAGTRYLYLVPHIPTTSRAKFEQGEDRSPIAWWQCVLSDIHYSPTSPIEEDRHICHLDEARDVVHQHERQNAVQNLEGIHAGPQPQATWRPIWDPTAVWRVL
jgi:hypothetical protein